MKLRLLVVFLFCQVCIAQTGGSGIPVLGSTQGSSGIGACGAATGYSNTVTLTLPAQSGLSADLPSNYPAIIHVASTFLESTGNGGFIQSSFTDFVPCTANNGTGTIIPYYFVPGSWDATTGIAEVVVLMPVIHKSTTSVIYAYVGKAGATDLSCGPSGGNNCSSTLFVNYLRAYDFGGVSAGTLSLVDETGNAASPTNHSATSAAGEINNSANFVGGSSQWIDSGSTLSALTNFGMEAWINQVQPPGSTQVFSMSNSDSGETAGIFMISTGTAAAACTGGTCTGFGYHTNASGFYYKECTLGNSNPTGWHHLVGSHTAGSGNMTMYLDGSPTCTGGTNSNGVSGGSPVDPGTSTHTFQMGRFGDSSTPRYYSGTHDFVRVMKFAPTADEALFDFNNQSGVSQFTVTTP